MEEEVEERPAKKVKKAKAETEEEEDEETSKPAKKSVKKSGEKSEKKPKKQRKPRQTNMDKYGIPYVPDTMVGKIFTLAKRPEGVPVTKVKALIEKYKQGKKGGYWVLSDIRKGEWKGVTWKVREDDGILKVSSVKAAA